jgi:hypothetical protein
MFKVIEYGIGTNKKSFSLTPYNSNQEKDILISNTLNDEKDQDKRIHEVFNFLKHNITPFDESITINEKKLILFGLRSISIGDDISIKNICPSCGKGYDSNLNISDFIKYPKNIVDSITINGIEFTFIDNFTGVLDDISDFIFKISKVVNKKIINSTDKDDIRDVIENLEINDNEILISFIKDALTVFDFSNTHKCPLCQCKIRFDMSDSKFVIETLSEDSLVSFYKGVSDLVYFGHYSKSDIYQMFPFERNVFSGLLQTQLDEYNKANPK